MRHTHTSNIRKTRQIWQDTEIDGKIRLKLLTIGASLLPQYQTEWRWKEEACVTVAVPRNAVITRKWAGNKIGAKAEYKILERNWMAIKTRSICR
jgi:hypothetical protein